MNIIQRVINAILPKKQNNNFGGGTTIMTLDELMSLGGNIKINKSTSYMVGESNKMALGYKRLISDMVARYGIQIQDDDGEVIDDHETVKKIKTFFGGLNFHLTVSDYFDEYFDNGQVFAIPSAINGVGLAIDKIKVLEGKSMTIKTDRFNKVLQYEYGKSEKFLPDFMVDHIIFRDRKKKAYGTSAYNGVVLDALTNDAGSKKQYRFMQNNQMPGAIVVLKNEGAQYSGSEVQEYNKLRKKKFGQGGDGQPLVSDEIDKVITIDATNVDADFLNIRNDNDDGFATVFLIDPRLIGKQKKTGSYGEVEVTVLAQANTQIETYATHFERWMLDCYVRFVDPFFPYQIKAKNGRFRNILEEKKIAIQETQNGLLRGEEYRERFDMEHDDDPALTGYYRNKGYVRLGDSPGDQDK